MPAAKNVKAATACSRQNFVQTCRNGEKLGNSPSSEQKLFIGCFLSIEKTRSSMYAFLIKKKT